MPIVAVAPHLSIVHFELESDDKGFDTVNPDMHESVMSPDTQALLHTQDVKSQCEEDNGVQKNSSISRFSARLLGEKNMRRLSNILACFGMNPVFEARRDYPVLQPDAKLKTSQNKPLMIDGAPVSVEDLAKRYQPKFKTVKPDEISDLRYEVLPPKTGNHVYSIMYYFKRETENMPIPIIGKMYDWLRVILFTNKHDWEVVQVDVNRDTGEAEGLSYETSNYTDNPVSYDTIQTRNLHLMAKLSKQNGKWQHTVYQKNAQSRTIEVADPFENAVGPSLVLVSWNGSLDLESEYRRRGGTQLSDCLQQNPLSFLDIRTFRQEGMDLRVLWTQTRKQGRCVMWMPARKPTLMPQRVTLMSS